MGSELALTGFRKHYFFWLDDESCQSPVEHLSNAFGYATELFDLSFARGLYSALQVLEAIRTKTFRPFDIAILDVQLGRSDQYFEKSKELADTDPRSKQPIFVDDKAELDRIGVFAEPERFGFDLDKVRKEAPASGGLFVWAWSLRLCSDAKYIVYSASDSVMSRIEFLRVAGVLELCNKLDLFHRRNPWEFIKNTHEPHFLRYKAFEKTGFAGISQITYMPFLHNGKVGEDLLTGCIVEKERDFFSSRYFTSGTLRSSEKALMIHEMWINQSSSKVKMIYEPFHDFLARTKVTPPRPYIVEKVIEMLARKIDNNEIDRMLARAIVTSEDSGHLWTVQIGDSPPIQRPSYLLPLGGNVDFENRVIKLKDHDEAESTYLFASFFLPWATALLSGDEGRIKTALGEIRAEFGDSLANGSALMRSFCRGPFRDFIEEAAIRRNADEARGALELYDKLKMDSVLSAETSRCLREYLEGNPPYDSWQIIKESVELTFKSLRSHLQEWKRVQNEAWKIEIIPSEDVETGKWYADMKWIKSVLDTVLNNLNSEKAFKVQSGINETPQVVMRLSKETEPGRITISIEDNGGGFDVKSLGGANRGYSRLLDGPGRKLLQSYGKLSISSINGERDLESGRVRSDVAKANGTLVTFSIILG